MPGGRWRLVAFLAILVVGVAACGSSDKSGGDSSSEEKSLVVASSDFPESKILAEMYGQALEANGFTVARRHGIGSRETFMPAMMDHSIDLVAEYIGNLLHYFDPRTSATSLQAIQQELRQKLPADLAILKPSTAVDTDTVTVTADTAKKWNLRTIADLVPHEAEVKIAAPPEFATRPHGLPGLKEKYDLDIRPENFVGISDGGGPATVRALVNGTVTAADIFSSLPAIPQNNLVVLKDPKNVFLANNVAPLVNAQKKSDELATILDAVSAKLTTAGLIGLNTMVSGNSGVPPEEAAAKWLKDNGFDEPVAK
jgi:osmoprotectant transport system substrate-binding protein